jgi:hypothetical protein
MTCNKCKYWTENCNPPAPASFGYGWCNVPGTHEETTGDHTCPKFEISPAWICPACEKDAGAKAENYGHMSGIYETHNCTNCGQFLVSDYSSPHFHWTANAGIDEVMADRVEWENQYIK